MSAPTRSTRKYGDQRNNSDPYTTPAKGGKGSRSSKTSKLHAPRDSSVESEKSYLGLKVFTNEYAQSMLSLVANRDMSEDTCQLAASMGKLTEMREQHRITHR